MDKIFLDTDVIIFLLKKEDKFIKLFINLYDKGSVFYYNPIVSAEIYAGAFKKEYPVIRQFFKSLECIDINDNIGKEAGFYANEFRKAHNNISLEDFIIAATVKLHNLKLWTNNTKHYPMKDIEFIP
jgi:predicted nucleic acid-binding protein